MGEATPIPKLGDRGSPAIARGELAVDRLALLLRNRYVVVGMEATGSIDTAPTALPVAPVARSWPGPVQCQWRWGGMRPFVTWTVVGREWEVRFDEACVDGLAPPCCCAARSLG